jgi:hypothetical protein
VTEGTQVQGADEKITYTLTTTNWASSPSSESMTVTKVSDGSDVTSSVTSGSISVSGDVITLKPIDSLTAGELYRVEVQFTGTGYAPAEAYFYIKCEA